VGDPECIRKKGRDRKIEELRSERWEWIGLKLGILWSVLVNREE
jgi:hypothetical protein